jgi:hypothetical protein
VLTPYFVLCCVMFLAMGSLMMALRSAAHGAQGLP